jgi:hypothetical protein
MMVSTLNIFYCYLFISLKSSKDNYLNLAHTINIIFVLLLRDFLNGYLQFILINKRKLKFTDEIFLFNLFFKCFLTLKQYYQLNYVLIKAFILSFYDFN